MRRRAADGQRESILAPPLGERMRLLLCGEAVDDLRLRETIAKALPLRVARDRQAL